MEGFLEALGQRVLVCDGAMGTVLYAKGVFLNRSFDELNVTQPDLVAEVHADYVRAGADVIETNTFGANRFKLASFGLADRARVINVEGARIARLAARERAWVAGSMGPLGVRIEPWGRTGTDEAETRVRRAGRGAARGRRRFVPARDLPRFERDARGHPRRAPRVGTAGRRADDDRGGRRHASTGRRSRRSRRSSSRRAQMSSGVNCSVGPAAMLETVEALARATAAPLSAPAERRPSARRGRPQPVSLLARVHGDLRAALRRGRGEARRRLLRHDA